MKKVLIIAYHFPPQSGSSGLLRSLKFSRYLLENGWQPFVLSIHPRAYERLDSQQLSEIPTNVAVRRTFALDTKRDLAIAGIYPRWLALPDRWISWCFSAVPSGLTSLYRYRIHLIFTTYPIATAVLIGLILHRLSRKPWIVDFRDSMTENDYPRDPVTRWVCRWIEKKAVQHASRLIFTAESARKMYLKRYPQLSPEACLVIQNGYDEEDFSELCSETIDSNLRPLRLLHAGLVYPEERDPRPFFRALARLKKERRIDKDSLEVDLRAPGSEDYYASLIREIEIEDIVHLLPPIPYREALRDCVNADGLILFQAAWCNHQIPAKAYEYLRLGKPILALTHHAGDTAALLKEAGGATIIDLADEQAIYLKLPDFLEKVRAGLHRLPDGWKVRAYSRKSQARQLAECMDALLQERARLLPQGDERGKLR